MVAQLPAQLAEARQRRDVDLVDGAHVDDDGARLLGVDEAADLRCQVSGVREIERRVEADDDKARDGLGVRKAQHVTIDLGAGEAAEQRRVRASRAEHEEQERGPDAERETEADAEHERWRRR